MNNLSYRYLTSPAAKSESGDNDTLRHNMNFLHQAVVRQWNPWYFYIDRVALHFRKTDGVVYELKEGG